MSDRELLELAAKAAEMPKGSVMGSGDYLYEKDCRSIYWNPSPTTAMRYGWL